MYYKSRHGKIWKNIKTGKIGSDKLELKNDEKLSDYVQISKPLPKKIEKPKNPTEKQPGSLFSESKEVL